MFKGIPCVLVAALCLVNSARGESFQVLFDFDTTTAAHPLASSLAVSGNTLYGITNGGAGASFDGTIYSINTDGTGYAIHHSFSPADGVGQLGSLVLSGDTFYAMANQGGTLSLGTIYSYSNSAGLTVLHNFSAADGDSPEGSLLLSGTTLYGLTGAGGTSGVGTIFSMDTSGGNYTVMHSFADQPTDGAEPYYTSLIQSGSTLYGMTGDGGANNQGAIFKINAAGGGYSLIHSFAGGLSDGAQPHGSLLQVGQLLYGMTGGGGASNNGTIFSYNIQTQAYNVLASFNGLNGAVPQGGFTQVGNYLYAMTLDGGANNDGEIFDFDPANNIIRVVHSFDASDGLRPYTGALTQVGNALYGNTFDGGPDNFGVVFAVTLPEPASLGLFAAVAGALLTRRRRPQPA